MLITWEIPRFQFPFLRTRRKNWSNSLYNIHSLSTSVLRSKPLYQLLKLSFWRQFCLCMHPSELFLMLLLYVGCLCSWGRGGYVFKIFVFFQVHILYLSCILSCLPLIWKKDSLSFLNLQFCVSQGVVTCVLVFHSYVYSWPISHSKV